MTAVALQFGYVNDQGENDAVVVSPSNGVTGTTLRDLVITAWRGQGKPTPLWVDGSPAALVALVATKLSIPSGVPDGWFTPITTPAATTESVELESEPDHEHKFVYDTRKTFQLFKKVGGGKAYTCLVDGCDVMQVRGRK